MNVEEIHFPFKKVLNGATAEGRLLLSRISPLMKMVLHRLDFKNMVVEDFQLKVEIFMHV